MSLLALLSPLTDLNDIFPYPFIYFNQRYPYPFIQLFRERLSEKNVHATIPNGNLGYDQFTVPDDCSCRTYFCCFPLALANIYPWPLVLFFQISLKNSELKTTHNSTYRDCREHFFRQRFSKWLYTRSLKKLPPSCGTSLYKPLFGVPHEGGSHIIGGLQNFFYQLSYQEYQRAVSLTILFSLAFYFRYSIVPAQEKCSICSYPLLTRGFYSSHVTMLSTAIV